MGIHTCFKVSATIAFKPSISFCYCKYSAACIDKLMLYRAVHKYITLGLQKHPLPDRAEISLKRAVPLGISDIHIVTSSYHFRHISWGPLIKPNCRCQRGTFILKSMVISAYFHVWWHAYTRLHTRFMPSAVRIWSCAEPWVATCQASNIPPNWRICTRKISIKIYQKPWGRRR